MSVDTPKDDDLEELLAGSVALREQFRIASREEPPAELDETIQAAARREVRPRSPAVGSGLGAAWRIPVSIAAVLVVSVTVAVMVARRDTPSSTARGKSVFVAPAGAPKQQAEPTLADRMVKDHPEADPAKTTVEARPRASVVAPSSPAPAKAAVQKAELEDKKMAVSPLARTEREQEESLGVQTRAKTDLPAAAEASAPGMAASATPPPPTAPEATAKTTANGTVVAQPLTDRRALSNFAEGESKASPWEKDPQTWLAHIEELRVAGRTEDAQASFRAFRNRYPDYQLPAGFVVPAPSVSD